ncbi:MAG: PEGA domain-containing protein [Candidatus Chisholmbacteria bacterium]|nr:PEGA domain-containing protein [Candidatus Chisholmbacteria bacterium]
MLSRFQFLAFLLGLSLVLTGCQLRLPFISSIAALEIRTTPPATVFINGKHVGQTPYTDNNLKAGEMTIKLVPEGNTSTSWETKVTLVPKIITVVAREFGPTEDQSAGHILAMEPLTKKDATALAIVSTPDSVIVQLDGQPQGFTPLSLDNLSAGEHTLVLTAPGYQDRTIKAKLASGHKLTVTAQLARVPLETTLDSDQEATPSATPQPSPKPKPSLSPSPKASPPSSPSASLIASASASAKTPPYVEILDNPLGFLRVREQPSTGGTELARAYPGQKLPYQNEEQNGWYKIEYASGKTGWVSRGASGEYAKLVQ